MMEFTNYLGKVKDDGSVGEAAWEESIETLLLLLAPTAPHLAEELWQKTGREYSIHNQRWPEWDETLVKEEDVVIPIQISGKVRDTITIPASIAESITDVEIPKIAKEKSERIAKYLEGKNIKKTIYITGKIANIITE